MISTIEWVPAGVADPVPKKYEMSSTERELIQLMEEQGNLDDVEAKIKRETAKRAAKKQPATTRHSDLPADLRMDEYSSDEEEDGEMAVGQLLVGKASLDTAEVIAEEDDNDVEENESDDGKKEASRDALNGSESASDSGDDDDDEDDLADVPDTREFMPVDVEGLEAMGLSQVGTNRAMYMDDFDEDEGDNSDVEDVKLTADDALVVVAKTEEDFASLEVHVYDRKTGNLYVHHDIPLPAFPLCLAHGQVSSNAVTGNFCAVGTFNPGIEIWNLDVLNALEPSCILGGEDTSSADELMKLQMIRGTSSSERMPRNLSNTGLQKGSHTDAVMSLSWNPVHKQVIASGSADSTVKLWDVTKAGTTVSEECNAATFSHHCDKVQSVAWHPQEGTLLATGSYDNTVALLDARGNGENVKKVKITADCEAICWDPCHPEHLTVASEDGVVSCWDVRKFDTSTPLWSFVASEFGVSDISYSFHVPGMLATCSVDKAVALWDAIHQKSASPKEAPRLCGSKDMCSGNLYTVSFYPSDPWLLGCGGSGNQLALWDLSGEDAIQKRFQGRTEKTGETEETKTSDLEANKDDFDAMMAEKAMKPESTNISSDRKKKKAKTKGKRKAHRRGRK